MLIFFCFPYSTQCPKTTLGYKKYWKSIVPPPPYQVTPMIFIIKKIKKYPEDSNHFYVKNTTYLKMSLS
jgi:hypothetical protein